jgi:RNA polymerase sigma-70 factor, ECF subfamily
MVAVWRKAALFDESKASVSTWIFTIARNLRIDRARKSARALSASEMFADPAEEHDPSAEDLALAGEREALVRQALASLSPEQAAVLRMSFFAEKPHVEIARELGIPLGTVKSRARLAMARIRAMLEGSR